MISKIASNKYRVTYSILIIITVVAAFFLYSLIVNNNEMYLLFSYIASVTTVVALIVAIFEIIHNISISLSIKQEAENLIYPLKYAMYLHASNALDNVESNLLNKKYLIAFTYFRTFENYYSNLKSVSENNISSLIDEIGNQILLTHTKKTFIEDNIELLYKRLTTLRTQFKKIEPTKK